MTDLYDIAKPVRDAAMAEVTRCLAVDAKVDGAALNPAVLEGHTLGTHLQALVVAWCGERFKTFQSGFTDDPITDIFAIAMAQVAAHVAATCRPTVGGRPVTPTQSGQAFLRHMAALYFEQLVHAEHGLQDFNIPLQRNADGSIEVEAFDYASMLNKGRGE